MYGLYSAFRGTIIACIGKCVDKCCGKTKEEKEQEVKQSSTYANSDDFISELKLGPLYQFYMRSEREFKMIKDLKEKDVPKDIDNSMIAHMKKRLKQRVAYIKNRFDKHLELLMKEVNKSDNPFVYEGINLKKRLTTKSKYKLVQFNEVFLQRRKVKERANILRMKGITQSYYMYDSQLYKNSKSALDEILE